MTAHRSIRAAAILLAAMLVLALTGCTGGISSNVDYEDANCVVSDLTIDTSEPLARVKANIRNKTNEPERFNALVTFFDSEGKEIGFSTLSSEDVPAGEEAPLDVGGPVLINDEIVESDKKTEIDKIARMEISNVYTGTELDEYQESKGSTINSDEPLIGYWDLIALSFDDETINLSRSDDAYAIFSEDKSFVIVVGDETHNGMWAEYDSEDMPYVFSLGNGVAGGEIMVKDGKTLLFMLSENGIKLLFER